MTTAPTAGALPAPAPTDATGARFARRVLRRPAGVLCLAYLLAVVVCAACAGWLAPYDPLEQDLASVLAGPSGAHLLGTDDLGRDVLSRLVHGAQPSLTGVAVAVVTLLVLALPLGVLAGYRGGAVDAVISRTSEVVLALPVILILFAVLAVRPHDTTAAMVTLGVLGAPGVLRVVRSVVLAVRQELYVAAARVAGLSELQIVVRHVWPRIAGAVAVQVFLFAAAALLTESALGFLGLGVQEPEPSWGGMVTTASNVISDDPWLLVPTGGAIGLTAFALALLGDVVRDASQPATARRVRSAPPAAAAPSPAGAMDTGALLEVAGLTVQFPGRDGAVTVLRDVSFSVRPGETVGLVGESGCGKSMTARAVLGLLTDGGSVTAGSVRWDGEELVGLPQRQLRRHRGSGLSLISQESIASLDPTRTVGAQLAQVVRLHDVAGRADVRARVRQLLEQVRLPDPAAVAKKYPHQLSGGMAQRVCIAIALAGRPRLLIADEPTTALDVTVQAEVLDLLRSLQQGTGMAVLLVTHDWGVVADSCDRTVVMYAGEVVEQASTQSVFDAPLHPYTDALLRSDPHAADVPPREDLPAIAGSVPPPGDWPRGCHFAARCPLAVDACRSGEITLVAPADGRLSRCLRTNELARPPSPLHTRSLA